MKFKDYNFQVIFCIPIEVKKAVHENFVSSKSMKFEIFQRSLITIFFESFFWFLMSYDVALYKFFVW